MALSTSQVNYLNIALMLGSAALAFAIPFELFLFSYALLGPLHYLTEISWLHKRNYFTLQHRDWRMLFVLAIGILIFSFGPQAMIALAGASILYQTQSIIREYPAQAHVAAALGLFSSVMTMFWYVLRLLSRR